MTEKHASPFSPAFFGYLSKIAVFFIVYYLFSELGLFFTLFDVTHATILQPSFGIAVAVLFLFGYELWPAVALGAFFAHLNGVVSVNLAVSAGNTIQALAGAYFLRRFGFGKEISRVRDAFVFVVFVTGVSALIGPAVGAMSLFLSGTATAVYSVKTFFIWLAGDAVSSVVFAPLVILWSQKKFVGRFLASPLQSVLLLVSILAIGVPIFIFNFFGGQIESVSRYVAFPLMMWSGFSFGSIGVVTFMFLMYVFTFLETLLGHGALSSAYGALDAPFLVFVSALSLSAVIFAAAGEGKKVFQEELEREEEKDEALLASIGEGLVALDIDGKVIKMNEIAENILGFRPGSMISKYCSEICKLEDEKGNAVPLDMNPVHVSMSSDKIVFSDKYYYIRKNGTKFPIEIVAAPIKNSHVSGSIVLIRDISERKMIDRAKSEFVSLASHQLRTPPSIINWYSEMLLSGEIGKINKKQKDYLEEIRRSNKRMIVIVNSLLNVSRIEMGSFMIEPKPMDLKAIAEETIRDMKPNLKPFGFKANYGADLKFDFDPILVQIVLQNLLSNAVKYNRPGGEINLDIKKSGDRMTIAVSDTGIGIPKEAQPKIFTKLFRADNARTTDPEGTGLGLYMVKSIVEAAGGDIRFESEENKGTTFYVSFPLEGMKRQDGNKQLIAMSRSMEA